jgi:hypothetical protein
VTPGCISGARFRRAVEDHCRDGKIIVSDAENNGSLKTGLAYPGNPAIPAIKSRDDAELHDS